MSRTKKHPAGLPYAVGDLYLAALPQLLEAEIEDVAPSARALKIRGHGWLDAGEFEAAVKARLGRVVYSAGLVGLKRKLIREVS